MPAAPALQTTAETAPPRLFAAAYEAEFDGVWIYLRRLGVPASDLEDAVHDVFVVAHRRYATYDPARPLRPWLLGIAFRIAAQWRRQRRHEVAQAEPGHDVADAAQRPDEEVAARQARSQLHAALARIDLDQRAVLVMHDLNGIAAPEIATALDVPLNTVYSRLRLGRAKIAAALRGER